MTPRLEVWRFAIGAQAPDAFEDGADDAVAPLACKSKRIIENHIDFLRERFAQQTFRAEKTRAHRRFSDTETRRGLLDRHLLQRAQDEYGAKC